MHAIILAGGIGTRLRPLSCTRPKLLFPVLNKPLLDWTIERLAGAGVGGVTLAVKYMAEVFKYRYGNSYDGLEISYSIEKKPMRTGGAIKYAEDLIGHKEPFLVLNGDIFSTIDYKAILNQHKENNAVATIALYQVEDPSRYGTVKLVENNRITQFVEKAPKEQAPSNFINAGIYVLDPKIFDYIPVGRPVSIEHEVFPKLAKEGKLFGYKFGDVWVDIGKPVDYLRANQMLLDAKQKKMENEKNINNENHAKIIDPVFVDVSVTVGPNSTVGPYVVIGKDSVLGENVCLENSVVFSDATISDNTKVTGAVIGEGVTIGKDVKIMEGAVIGDYVTIKDNVTVSKNVTICHSKEITKNITESARVM